MKEKIEDCIVCRRVEELTAEPENPFLIYEFPESYLIVGDHQFYRGYCQLIYKTHAREMHELAPEIQSEIFAELMLAARAVAAAFTPWKINYSCYGNVVPHIHWHIFPRSAADPEREQVPWTRAAKFSDFATDEQTAREISLLVRREIENLI